MYTKAELIENRKLEKILKENKYKMRNIQNRRNKKEKINTIISCLLFGIGFIAVMYFIAIIENINF